MKSNAVTSVDLELDWTAQTILPIEFRGQELKVEARAYQGTDPDFQALVLVHREKQEVNETAGRPRPQRLRHRATSSIRCAATAIRSCKRRWTRSLTSPLGILVYLPYQEGRGIGLVNKIRAYACRTRATTRSTPTSPSAPRSRRATTIWRRTSCSTSDIPRSSS